MNIRKTVISKECISIENGNGKAYVQPILLQDYKKVLMIKIILIIRTGFTVRKLRSKR